MDNKTIGLISFVVGASVGVLASMQYFKKKYKNIAEEEVQSVKDVFNMRHITDDYGDPNQEQGVAVNPFNLNNPENIRIKNTYSNLVRGSGYSEQKESETNTRESEEKENMSNRPYVIEPDAVGEEEEYETISLTYFADKVLTDDDNQLVDNVDEIIGLDSLNHFGEYEDDSVFVRNDTLKCYYEILLDARRYSDVIADSIPPHVVD
jgi:hypothetical protein